MAGIRLRDYLFDMATLDPDTPIRKEDQLLHSGYIDILAKGLGRDTYIDSRCICPLYSKMGDEINLS